MSTIAEAKEVIGDIRAIGQIGFGAFGVGIPQSGAASKSLADHPDSADGVRGALQALDLSRLADAVSTVDQSPVSAVTETDARLETAVSVLADLKTLYVANRDAIKSGRSIHSDTVGGSILQVVEHLHAGRFSQALEAARQGKLLDQAFSIPDPIAVRIWEPIITAAVAAGRRADLFQLGQQMCADLAAASAERLKGLITAAFPGLFTPPPVQAAAKPASAPVEEEASEPA